MPKILFIAAHRPERSPSQRFRFEQYISFLEQNGFACDFSWLISEQDDRIFYQPGNLHNKLSIFTKSIYKRLKDVLRAGNYDIVFVQREAFMTGSVFFEKRFKKSGAKLIFDFDDAIWLPNVSEANRKWNWLKRPEKTSEIIRLSDHVIAGNSYLAAYAKNYNPNVTVIPTTIDTDVYVRLEHTPGSPVCIGWSGSITTIRHFESAVPVLKKIKNKYGSGVFFKVVGDESYKNDELNIAGIPWSPERELSELQLFDIGIMPLPDDEWAKGKCGLKGLAYMSVETSPVMSPVGVNSEIIRNGQNGFLAATDEDWVK